MTKITLEKLKEACLDSGGIKNIIARRLSVSREALFYFLRKHPEYEKFIEYSYEILGDKLENKMQEKALAGEFKALRFILETKYKNRGYSTKQEIQHTGIVPTHITFDVAEESKHNTDSKAEDSVELPDGQKDN